MFPMPSHPSREPALLASSVLVALIALALALAAGPVRAQTGFTEFSVTDTSLNSSPETDFWIASAAPADVDGDGDLDLLVAGYYVVYATATDPGSFEDRLTLYRNDGPAGAAWALVPIPIDALGLSFTAADLAWGDYDGDGDPDVVVGTTGDLVLYRNDAGTLVRTPTALPSYLEDNAFTTMDLRSLSWADFDNDGDLDLLVPSAFGDFDWVPTRMLRNDGPGAAGTWTFTDVSTALPIAPNAVSAWADMEGDGDLDLLLGHVSPYGDNFLGTWRNDAGVLVPAQSGLAFIRYGTADWGDADNDGDLDIVYAGNMDLPDETGETAVRILFNDGAGNYTNVLVAHDFGGPDMAWLDFSAVTWADYDSDGDVDLLVSGEWLGPGEIEGRAVVYANNGGVFTLASQPLPAPVAGNAGGAFTWFDVDGDGDLDYFVAGAYYVPNGNGLVEARTQLFRNDALSANASPTAPNSLSAAVTGHDALLTWHPSTDDRTPPSALTYELSVVPAGAMVKGPNRVPVATRRALPQPGNVSDNVAWSLKGLPNGLYHWSVRALDTAFNGGPIARGIFQIGSTTDAEIAAPRGPALSAPRPNPFGPEALLTLTLQRAGQASVTLHDVGGRRVATLLDGPLSAGDHLLTLRGEGLASGTYFVRARVEGRMLSRRVTLVR
jgi:hypothetical protein